MMEFENTIHIDRPISDVFAFVSDLENLPNWNYFITSVTKTSSGDAGVGSTYHQVRKTDSQDYRIVELKPDQSLVVKTIPPSKPKAERKMTFQAKGEITKLIDSWRLDTGHPGIIQRFARRGVKSAVNENLDKLKELLETGEVTLQDGRIVRL